VTGVQTCALPILTMPGLPRVPAANSIRLNAQGLIEGLF